VLADVLAQARGDLLQQQVAGVVAADVVDGLELVEVDVAQRVGLAGLAARVERALQAGG